MYLYFCNDMIYFRGSKSLFKHLSQYSQVSQNDNRLNTQNISSSHLNQRSTTTSSLSTTVPRLDNFEPNLVRNQINRYENIGHNNYTQNFHGASATTSFMPLSPPQKSNLKPTSTKSYTTVPQRPAPPPPPPK